jgi:uncharacterized protein YeeX (DUF496 family)
LGGDTVETPNFVGRHVRRDDRGKVLHVKLNDFASSELKHKWSAEIISAMRADYPNFDVDDEPAIDAVQEILE